MRLDRNTNPEGVGKYALVNHRKIANLSEAGQAQCLAALRALEGKGVLEFGLPGSPDEFFVLKLKDRLAAGALHAYADAAEAAGMREFAADVAELARRSEAFPAKQFPS